jgi:Family of unknown function (DUF6049)
VTGGWILRILTLVCRRTSSATLLAISFLAISALPITAVFAAGPASASIPVTDDPASTSAAAPAQSLTVSLARVTPTVAVPAAPIKITGSVRNSGALPIAAPVARALLGQSSLNSRQAVSDWASTSAEPFLDEVARTSVGKTLLPGAVAVFTLTIPANAISHSQPFAVLPMRVEVTGTTTAVDQSGDVHTFLPTLGSAKEYEQISVAWLIPLTLDPDPALLGPASTTRTSAWKRAIGPGSRLDRLIQGTENAGVTWAIDPAILGPQETPLALAPAAPSPSPSPTSSASGTPPTPGGATAPDPVTAATAELAARLKAAAPEHTLWSLPYGDPDLAALLPLSPGNQILKTVISHPSAVNAAVGPARADIAWPADGTLTPQRQTDLRRAFASPGLAAAVTSASTLTSRNGATSDATRRTNSGLPLLAYDEPLSRTVAQTSSKATAALTIQRFLADSMALLGERPGTPNRSVLVAEPRTFAGDPAVLQSLFAAVAKAPWLIPATTVELLSVSRKLAPEGSVRDRSGTATAPPSLTPGLKGPDPLNPGISPVSSDQLTSIPGTLSDIDGIASIMGNGRLFRDTWTDAQVQTLSTRWRGHPHDPAVIDAATRAAIRKISANVRVAPSAVNFFADRGVMQVTVVNDLAVPIHDVRLTLSPAQPRLRIEQQPPPLRIGANSRANVRLQVTSIAAGLVNVNAVLATPNGTPLGQEASVNVRVHPPASWIYWGLGGLAGVVLVLGTARSLRRGSTRAARPEGQEPLLDD